MSERNHENFLSVEVVIAFNDMCFNASLDDIVESRIYSYAQCAEVNILCPRYQRIRCINALGGKDLPVRQRDIRGRVPELPASPVAADNGAKEKKRVSEPLARIVEVAAVNEPSNS